MAPLKKLTLRLAIYGAVVGYMVVDLFLIHGPLARWIDASNPNTPENIAAAKARGVVARVFGHQINRGQLDRAIAERLWLTGSSMPTDPESLKRLRYAALNDLIDHELLRVKAKAWANEVALEPGELEQRLERFKRRFPDEKSMRAAMKSQGIPSESALRDRLAAHIQQEKYVELKIADLVTVTDEEARDWFGQHQDALAHPPQVMARHIFLPSLEFSDAKAKTALDDALTKLRSGVDFPTLARELSQDPRTAPLGGELGWLSKERLPAELAGPLFDLPLNQPTILQSKIGWHLAEVTAKRPQRTRTFEEARDEVLAALTTIKRQEAARKYRQALRQFEAHKIEVFHDMMAD